MGKVLNDLTIRERFVQCFDEKNALTIEAAANEHANGVNNENRGSDVFRWALLICIGYQCMEKDEYREYHGITAPWPEIDQWMIDEAELHNHKGDFDYLALFAGAYNKYLPEELKTIKEG